jgi:FkbM family methyltransferase
MYEKEFRFLLELIDSKSNSSCHPSVSDSESANILVLDIGANVGQSAYALTKLFPFSKVMCFEPNPVVLKQLKENSLERWETVGLGLSGNATEITLNIPSYNGIYFTGLTSIDQNSASRFLNSRTIWNFKFEKFELEPHQVKTKDLDSFEFSPDVIKIDTEGNDYKVLLGSEKILRVTDIVMFEIMFKIIEYGSTPQDVIKFLKELDFRYFYRSTKYFGLVPISNIKPFEISTQNIVASRNNLR